MYIPSRGVIVLLSNSLYNPNINIFVREYRDTFKIDLGPALMRESLRRENKQREQDTRKGIWRYK